MRVVDMVILLLFEFPAPTTGALRHAQGTRLSPGASATVKRKAEGFRCGKRPWQLYRPGGGIKVPVMKATGGAGSWGEGVDWSHRSGRVLGLHKPGFGSAKNRG